MGGEELMPLTQLCLTGVLCLQHKRAKNILLFSLYHYAEGKLFCSFQREVDYVSAKALLSIHFNPLLLKESP